MTFCDFFLNLYLQTYNFRAPIETCIDKKDDQILVKKIFDLSAIYDDDLFFPSKYYDIILIKHAVNLGNS